MHVSGGGGFFMAGKQVSRRTVLQAGVSAAAFAATTNIFTPLKTFAARKQKLVFWMQPLFNKEADEIMLGQVRDYAKQAGLKDDELEIQTVPGGEVAKKMAAALKVEAIIGPQKNTSSTMKLGMPVGMVLTPTLLRKTDA